MRIVVDVSDISPRRGKSKGIYNYARMLVAAMLKALPERVVMVVLCNGDSKADFEAMRSDRMEVVAVFPGFPNAWQRVLWCLFTGAWAVHRRRGDVFFSPKGYAPLLLRAWGGVRLTVVTIHDLIPLWYAKHHPGATGRLERLFVNAWLTRSARKADRVVAVSQATADALRDELGRADDVFVVRNAVPVLPPPPPGLERRHIFAMTSLLPHKNLPGILAAYQAYRKRAARPLPMVVCGVAGDLGDGVVGLVDRRPHELAELYGAAQVFLFLPAIEGFGFPVAEALSLGTPVVCSDIAALREASGGAATYVAPDDPQAAASALLAATEEGHSKRAAAAFGAEPEGGWPRCALQTLAVLQPPSTGGQRAAPLQPGGPSQPPA